MSPDLDRLNILGSTFDRHLFACSVMAGALAAGSSPCAADVISVTGLSYTVTAGKTLYIDIDGGVASFSPLAGAEFALAYKTKKTPVSILVTYYYNTYFKAVSDATVDTLPIKSVEYVDNLAKGTIISGVGFKAGFGLSAAYFPMYGVANIKLYSTKKIVSTVGPYGEFDIPPGSATGNYIGFTFTKDGDTTVHNGWASISLSGAKGSTPTLTGFGWDDIAGTSIAAGATSAVPEPASMSLAALAMGAAGLNAWRRRRTHAAPEQNT